MGIRPGRAITIAAAVAPVSLLPRQGRAKPAGDFGHAQYETWSYRGAAALPLDDWRKTVTQHGDVLRMKGYLNTPNGTRHLVQLVGEHWAAEPVMDGPTELVVIGLQDRLDPKRFSEALR